jgi:RNA polymerase sigma factor (sigma-70 family)
VAGGVRTARAADPKPPFEQVVRDHGATVLRVARAVVGPVDADDAWSETFLSAMQAYPDLDAAANLQAWLVTIAHRKAIDVTRRRARAPEPVPEPPEAESRDGIPGARDDEVWTAVAALPEKQRLCIAYHYLGGLPYAQVAAIVGGSADAARRAAHDGIRKLRQTYDPSARAPQTQRGPTR